MNKMIHNGPMYQKPSWMVYCELIKRIEEVLLKNIDNVYLWWGLTDKFQRNKHYLLLMRNNNIKMEDNLKFSKYKSIDKNVCLYHISISAGIMNVNLHYLIEFIPLKDDIETIKKIIKYRCFVMTTLTRIKIEAYYAKLFNNNELEILTDEQLTEYCHESLFMDEKINKLYSSMISNTRTSIITEFIEYNYNQTNRLDKIIQENNKSLFINAVFIQIMIIYCIGWTIYNIMILS